MVEGKEDLLDDQIACWIKRPIVVYADEFTVDSTRGQVTEPFKMVIPRLSKYGDQPVFVTPFTTLLTELIIEAKREILEEELPFNQGCAEEGWLVDDEIESRVNDFDDRFFSLYGFRISDLVTDFIGTVDGKITEERAGELVDIFLKQVLPLEESLTQDVSEKFDQYLPVTMYLNEEARNKIFDEGDLNDIEFNFHGSFISPINENLENRYNFYATEITLNDQNELTRYYCSPNSVTSCTYNEFSLNGVKRSARNYNFQQSLVDESVDLSALPTTFTNTDYEFALGEESFGFWDYDPNRPDEDYQIFCQDRKKFSLTAQDADATGNLPRKVVELLVQKDTTDEFRESCYPIRDWYRELIQYQTYNIAPLSNGDGTSVAITEPPYSRGLPQFFDCCGNSVLGFSLLDYFNQPEAYDTEDLIADLISLDYSFGNYPFFSRRGLGANYVFNTRDSVERLQWAFSSNDGNYRWKSRLEFGTSPLEGGQFTVQQTWFGQSAVDEFWDRIEEYGIQELVGDQGKPRFTELTSMVLNTKNIGLNEVRNTPLYLNLTRQQQTLGEKYVGDAVQANLMTKFKKEWLVSELKGQEIAYDDEVEILVRHRGADAYNPELLNKTMNFEVTLTQYREGSNPGVQSNTEDRIFFSAPIVMNSVEGGVEFVQSEGAVMRLIKNDGSQTERTIDASSQPFVLTSSNQDVLEMFLNQLRNFYSQVDQSDKERLEAFFDVKSYASVYFNNNFINSSGPLWRSFDLFEGPIEYYSDEETNFENLLYFAEDSAATIISGQDQGTVCVGLGNKTSDVVTARLVVKGPESYDFNETLPETSDLELSSYQLNWGTDSQNKCVSVRTSETYDDKAYDKNEAYYFIEIIPEIDGIIYRGNMFPIEVLDKYR